MPRCLRLEPLALLLAAGLLVGCEKQPPAGQGDPPPSGVALADALPDKSARQLLDGMVAAYRSAKTYADAGQGRWRFAQADQQYDQPFAMSVTFERPNKLRMHAYDAVYFSDGVDMRGSVGELPGQVLAAKAPPELTFENIYGHDQLLTRGLGGEGSGLAGTAPQLLLLLTNQFLEVVLKDGDEPQRLDPRPIGDVTCYGVSVQRPDGRLVLWIEPRTCTLRRIELPTDALAKQIAPDGRIADLSLVIDFPGATLDGPIAPEAFEYRLPAGAKLVDAFDLRPLLPAPTPPSPLLGQKPPGSFSFAALDGTPVTGESLAGKIVVLDFWATWCAPCLEGLPRLQQVYDKYKDDDRVRFYAVTSDGAEKTNEELQSALTSRNVSIPIVRDPNLAARDVFRVEMIPNTFVLGADGTVQVNEIGAGPRFADELTAYLEKLLAGQNVADEVKNRYAFRLAEYEKQMKEPVTGQPGTPPVDKAQVAPASDPVTLRRNTLWATDKLRFAGNILPVPAADGATRLLVVDGGQTVVELDFQGQLVATHKLTVPAGADVTYLRTAVDARNARWFVGSAPAAQQCHVFDDQWQTTLSFPAEGRHAGISDLQLADLEADGQLEMIVGYWDDVGIQAVTLAGERIWSNRSIQDVYSIALTAPDAAGQRALLCANRRGTLATIDSGGNAGKDLALPDRYFRLIAAADLDGDGRVEYCGVSISLDGSEQAVGLTSAGAEAWTYPLPKGAHPQPVEMIQAGDLLGLGKKQWLLAAADGSLHIIAADGHPLDKFNYGAEISGVAVALLADRPALIVASRKEGIGNVEALELIRNP